MTNKIKINKNSNTNYSIRGKNFLKNLQAQEKALNKVSLSVETIVSTS